MNTFRRNDRGETEPGVVLSVVGGVIALIIIGGMGEPLPDTHGTVLNSQTGTNTAPLDGAPKGGPSVVLVR